MTKKIVPVVAFKAIDRGIIGDAEVEIKDNVFVVSIKIDPKTAFGYRLGENLNLISLDFTD